MTARLIGLCPLLAVSDTSLKAAAIGILLGAIMIVSGITAAVLRNCVNWGLKPIYHALIAAFSTTIVVAIARIAHYEVIDALGVFPALIASNCLVLSYVQEIAERNSLKLSLHQGLQDFAAVFTFIVIFGAVREIAAYGALFVEEPLGVGPLPIIASAPGALLMLALVLAAVNAVTKAQRGASEIRSRDPLMSNIGALPNSKRDDEF